MLSIDVYLLFVICFFVINLIAAETIRAHFKMNWTIAVLLGVVVSVLLMLFLPPLLRDALGIDTRLWLNGLAQDNSVPFWTILALIVTVAGVGIMRLNRGVMSVKLNFLLGAATTLVIALYTLFFLIWDNPCFNTIHANFHMFKQHIRDLCKERSDNGECPASIAELESFRPREFDRMRHCASSVEYVADLDARTYLWRVEMKRGQTYFATEEVDFAAERTQ